MSTVRFASRYAKALIDLAKELNQMDAVFADMQDVKESIADSRDLKNFLQSPVVKPELKERALSEIFKGTSDLTKRFIALVIHHGREGELSDIAERYIIGYRTVKGIVQAVVTTAAPMDSAQRDAINNILRTAGATETSLEEVVDADAIGGIKVRVGDRQVDATIATALKDLDRQFQHNPYIADF